MGALFIGSVFSCAIASTLESVSSLITSLFLYLPMFLGGLPAGSLLIGSFLLVRRLIGDKYKDDNTLFVSVISSLNIELTRGTRRGNPEFISRSIYLI